MTCGYVKSRVAITLVRATHQCIRGSRVPAHRISVKRPQWEYGAGLNLFGWGPQITISTPCSPNPSLPPLHSNHRYQTPHWTRGGHTGPADSMWVAKELKGGQGTPVPPWGRPTLSRYKLNKLFYIKKIINSIF